MNEECPKCKSKNTICLRVFIDEVGCRCLDCKHEFKTIPSKERRDEFNG